LLPLLLLFISPALASTEETEFETYINQDFNFSINYPSNWDVEEFDLQENDVVHFLPDENTEPVRVIKIAIMNLDLLPMDYRNLTLQELVDTSIVNSGNSRTISMTNTTLSGYPAVERIYYLYFSGVSMKSYEIMALADNNDIISIHYLAEPAYFDEFLPQMYEIIKSFKIGLGNE